MAGPGKHPEDVVVDGVEDVFGDLGRLDRPAGVAGRIHAGDEGVVVERLRDFVRSAELRLAIAGRGEEVGVYRAGRDQDRGRDSGPEGVQLSVETLPQIGDSRLGEAVDRGGGDGLLWQPRTT